MNIKRWSQARLDKEIAFAAGFDLQEGYAFEWLRLLMAENHRRQIARRASP